MSARPKWGDVDENAELKEESKVGPIMKTISEKTTDGTKTIQEEYTNEKGQRIRVTRVLKITRKQLRVNKNVAARRRWAKFGACTGLPEGPENNVTYTSHEQIHLDVRPKLSARGESGDVEHKDEPSALDLLQPDKAIVVCRNCGETGHWTLKCPKRNKIVPTGFSEENLPPSATEKGSTGKPGSGKEGKYVAPRRGPNEGQSNRDQEPTLRVTNLSEDTSESDLQELFRRFGHTSRIYLAKDRQTQKSRGFAFVNFVHRDDAQKAIDKLNGWGYDNLILQVEWARDNRPAKTDKDKEESSERPAERPERGPGGSSDRAPRGWGGGGGDRAGPSAQRERPRLQLSKPTKRS
jgi:translation initiation factor 3 subunit G